MSEYDAHVWCWAEYHSDHDREKDQDFPDIEINPELEQALEERLSKRGWKAP
jgi:hypothetical protein